MAQLEVNGQEKGTRDDWVTVGKGVAISPDLMRCLARARQRLIHDDVRGKVEAAARECETQPAVASMAFLFLANHPEYAATFFGGEGEETMEEDLPRE